MRTAGPLAFQKQFRSNPAAMAWLWKDHTSVSEAADITELAKKMRPHYLASCGGTYSSEWFWSKIWKLPAVRAGSCSNAAYSWVELADYVPAALTGTEHPDKRIAGRLRGRSQAMWNAKWSGYPDENFFQARSQTRATPQAAHAAVHSVDCAPVG